MTLIDFLDALQGQYEAAGSDGLEAERRRSAPLPDGTYEAQIVGVGWRDHDPTVEGGWQGMGLELRARVIKGDDAIRGRYLRIVYWLVEAHPAAGIAAPQVRQQGVQALKTACSRLGVLPPVRLSEGLGWTAPRGLLALVRLATVEANRQRRSTQTRQTAIQALIDPAGPRRAGWQPFPAEYLGTDGVWYSGEEARPDR